MATRVLRMKAEPTGVLRDGIAKVQAELGVSPDFPADVESAAEQAAQAPRLPEKDLTELPFVTIDPESAMDLDQAMHLAREGDGYVVHYAIADVAAFVEPGGPVDVEANRRGETLYGADSKVPLHPKSLSEAAASLLPGETRPAFVWTLVLDADGNVTSAGVERALVRSTAKLSYDEVQARGAGDELFDLLQAIGERRIAIEQARGGVNLPMPEQEIRIEGDQWHLEFRSMLPVEEWNAQISLMTGFAAAQLMVDNKVGILRTLPEPEQRSVDRLRKVAKGLGIDWPAGLEYPAFIRALDPDAEPKHAAMVVASTSLLRGAAYVAFDGEVPEQTEHSALASAYTHCTAPLRRLVDRYTLETCVALTAGQEVPAWVREALPKLPETMQETGRKAHAYENAVLDLVEAVTLQSQVGKQFRSVVVEVDHENPTQAQIQIEQPAIEAHAIGQHPAPLGEELIVTLQAADPATRKVTFVY